MKRAVQFLNPIWKGTLRAYPQILFSENIYLGAVLLLVSFVDVNAGMAGLIVALSAGFSAMSFGLDPVKTARGVYTFNALLTGLGLGVMYELGSEMYVILIFTGLLCLILTTLFEGMTSRYGLPFLSLPFLASLWIIILAIRGFSDIQLSERTVYYYNYLYSYWGKDVVDIYEYTQNLPVAESLRIYFSSLGAIFFQPSVVAGMVIAAGIFMTSRISFLFSLAGFYSGWFFFYFTGGDMVSLSYSYVGFNFILTAIAIGGFFVIPSWRTLLLVVLITPVNVILTQAMVQIFGVWQLPVYSLPFVIIVILFLYVLKFRVRFHSYLPEVAVQEYSPEKNLYSYKNYLKRFGSSAVTFPLRLPFWGEWTVEQAHDGDITHKDEYRHAWDFAIRDNDGKTFKKPGTGTEDFYCFKKAVLSPGYGRVVKITDGIADNAIGDANLNENWGNLIIIQHSDFLYTKLCHLHNGSFKVSEGDYVYPGQVVASVGNSGRSPEPHLHMQMQPTPWPGSATIRYPIAHFMLKNGRQYQLRNYHYPQKDETVVHPEPTAALAAVLDMIPGRKMAFEYRIGNELRQELWTVYTDSANKSYIFSETTQSLCWFSYDKTMLYFHHFSGKRNSLLYYYFLAFYKVQSGFYNQAEIHDDMNLTHVFRPYILFFNDLTAPFFSWLSASYKMTYSGTDDDLSPGTIRLKSEVQLNAMKHTIKSYHFDLTIENGLISHWEIMDGKKIIKAKQIS
jgi:urea transporter